MADIRIEAVDEVTPEVVEAFERLIPQLSSSNPPPSEAQLEEIVASPATTVLVARDAAQDDRIVGSMTLVVFRIPTALRAWIEDVVVDESSRRAGVGAALNEEAIRRARELGCKTVDLTSRPKREAANRLYRRLGFEQRDTNVYRLML